MRKRAGGTVTNVIIGLFVLYLVFSVIVYFGRSLDQMFSGASDTTPRTATTITGDISATNSTSLGSVASTHVADNFSLAQLQSLSFSNSSKCDGLLDPKYWDIVIRTSGNTTANLVPNTVYGLTQSWNGWVEFFRTNMSDPPTWLPFGLENYTRSLEAQLSAKVLGTDNATRAAAVMKNYTSDLSAFEATSVDLLSWGGLSGVRVYYQTGDFRTAAAQTFPAQLDQLFKLSQDCSYSEQQRGKFLGMALSMGGIVLASSREGGFGPQFQDLLTKLGLRDAWPGIKGSLKTINDASPSAAYQTTVVLAELAKKFPSSQFPDLASSTSSRIANMVQVLKDKGFSDNEISQKVSDLSQAVDESDEGGHVADVADATSYRVEGFMRVNIDQNLEARLLSTPPHHITASFMALVLPDFKTGDVTALKVTVHRLGTELPSFHVYEGGKYVTFGLPKEEVQPGDDVGLSFEVLPVEDFARSIPPAVLSNAAHLPWIADAATLRNFNVADGVLKFDLLQNNPWWSGGDVNIQGQVVAYPEVSSSGGIYAEFAVKDYAGRTRDLRLRYDGFSFEGPDLQLVMGQSSNPISLVSFDGYRLQLVYRSNHQVATIYLKPPSEAVFSQDAMHTYSGPYLDMVQGKYTNAWQIDKIMLARDLENSMFKYGSTYVVGRLGSENAYVVCEKQLHLKDVIIEEPSHGGRDLYTRDNTVAIQARFLKNLGGDAVKTIQANLLDLAKKLQEDYQNQPQMTDGYAVLSYVDTDGAIRAIVLEVPKW